MCSIEQPDLEMEGECVESSGGLFWAVTKLKWHVKVSQPRWKWFATGKIPLVQLGGNGDEDLAGTVYMGRELWIDNLVTHLAETRLLSRCPYKTITSPLEVNEVLFSLQFSKQPPEWGAFFLRKLSHPTIPSHLIPPSPLVCVWTEQAQMKTRETVWRTPPKGKQFLSISFSQNHFHFHILHTCGLELKFCCTRHITSSRRAYATRWCARVVFVVAINFWPKSNLLSRWTGRERSSPIKTRRQCSKKKPQKSLFVHFFLQKAAKNSTKFIFLGGKRLFGFPWGGFNLPPPGVEPPSHTKTKTHLTPGGGGTQERFLKMTFAQEGKPPTVVLKVHSLQLSSNTPQIPESRSEYWCEDWNIPQINQMWPRWNWFRSRSHWVKGYLVNAKEGTKKR